MVDYTACISRNGRVRDNRAARQETDGRKNGIERIPYQVKRGIKMSVTEFIKHEINKRAAAARILRDDIKINDIDICAGCYGGGIRVWSGIERIAEITDTILTESEEINNDWKKVIISCEVNGITFYEERVAKVTGSEDAGNV